MSKIDLIREPVAKELKQFDEYYGNLMKSKIPLLKTVTNYLYRRKGKQVRPLLVFLTSGLNGGINQSTHVAAAMTELLHTATLIHDDVVDEAYERRGAFSINALWRSKIAVLAGDFLLSKGLLVAIENNEFELLRNMSHAVKEMSEGELAQIKHAQKMDIDEESYFEIIRKKTATLIASCTLNGAQAAGADPSQLEKMYEMGEKLGLAFQLKDDLLDFEAKGITGKPARNDLKERKLTLPIIYALTQVDKREQKRVRQLLRKCKNSSKAIDEVVNFIDKHGGIEYATNTMLSFAQQAKDALNSYPDSVYKESLVALIDYTVTRRK